MKRIYTVSTAAAFRKQRVKNLKFIKNDVSTRTIRKQIDNAEEQ